MIYALVGLAIFITGLLCIPIMLFGIRGTWELSVFFLFVLFCKLTGRSAP